MSRNTITITYFQTRSTGQFIATYACNWGAQQPQSRGAGNFACQDCAATVIRLYLNSEDNHKHFTTLTLFIILFRAFVYCFQAQSL
jgi:hypothetical protein